jgi:hypothetical protein
MKQAVLAPLAFAAAQLISVAAAPSALAQVGCNPIVCNTAQASLLEENPSNPLGTRLAGTVSWRLQHEATEPGSGSRVQVSVDIEIPARGLMVFLTIRPNRDPVASVSHFLETKFYTSRDFQHGGVSSVRGIMMKPFEHAVGTPLHGHVARLLPNVFALGLAQADVQGNVELLYGRPWLEIAIVYTDGQRALLAFSKGAAGEQALKQALASWAQLDPQVDLALNRIDGQRQSQTTTPQANESERENLKAKLTSTYGIKTWTDDRALSRNPFVFKNDVVALFTVFHKMLLADQALFVHNEPVIAVEAPTTLFRNSENVVLAIEVVGTRLLRLPLGETTATIGKYVGAYKCERRGCEEVFGR